MSLSSRLPSFAFYGRTLADYAAFLDLDPAGLAGRRVLDVASGPASFAAEATRLGADVVAVDPLYARGPDALATLAEAELGSLEQALRDHAPRYRLDGEAAIPALVARRREAASRFLRDYGQGRATGRYVAAGLPELPFRNGTFDLVTCAHFLFLYADRLDRAFHLAALRELARVSRGDVRLYPLVDLDGNPLPGLDDLLARLRHVGIQAEFRRVAYEVQRGADTMLVLRRP